MLPARNTAKMGTLYTNSTAEKSTKVKVEKMTVMAWLVRKFSMRRWSSMRCSRSPVSLVSKNFMGNFISLIKKSEMSEMLMRVLMCNRIFRRIKSMAVRLKSNIICAIRISQIKPISFPWMPVSTIAWVRNGEMSCSVLPMNNPNTSCPKKRL